MVDQDREPWEVVQVMDTITPGNPHYSEASRLAKTMLKDGTTWGAAPGDESQLAHGNERMTCYACHSSWTTSCFGCHLPMSANAQDAHAAQRRDGHAQLHRRTTSRCCATTFTCWAWMAR